ncbi:histidine phosphatase family protein [Peptostreptococcus canis]|uniref:phosphoglycerate mutase (2,3-diphosphoglycerate-dependent) n=1 Tax=Peptostreptococcus canis TaxID=1159213 RepID=A0ABR6TIQ0_9FIRM|nr:histidine phosphatase family protein [Peptostreptococcus canis]MBC2575294.1 histidine phosphatase family protein [Peptostreptococcus canis]MBP1997523.1 alpha-ribazole phosphatase [Peptostreptococcus canis]
MKSLYLIRHGHTVDNENYRYSGFSDCDLSEVGRKQVEGLTDYIKDIDVDRVYASTLKRTAQTIDDYAKIKNQEIVKLDGLKEMNFGIFDGYSLEEIKKKFPKESSEMLRSDFLYRFPEGENIEDFYIRNIKALNDIMKESKDMDNIMICAHMGTIRNLLSHLLVGSYKLHWNFNVHNATVTKIEFFNEFPALTGMGYIPYDRSLIRTYPKKEK